MNGFLKFSVWNFVQEVCQLRLGFSVGKIVQEFCTISLKPNNQDAFSKEKGFRS